MTPKKRFNYVVLIFVIGVFAVVASALLATASKPKPAPLPVPNGYDDFVEAHKMLMRSGCDYEKLSKEELRKYIETNAAGINRILIGLEKSCRMPESAFITNYRSFGVVSAFFSRPVSSVAQIFSAKARLARLEGRTNDAAQDCLQGIRFSNESSRGGLWSDHAQAIAYGMINFKSLDELTPTLNSVGCRQVARNLEQIDSEAESTKEIIERTYEHAPSPSNIREFFQTNFNLVQKRKTRQHMIEFLNVYKKFQQLAMLKFAARAYELEKGKPPKEVSDLVPDYLKKIPQDPATGKNLSLTTNRITN